MKTFLYWVVITSTSLTAVILIVAVPTLTVHIYETIPKPILAYGVGCLGAGLLFLTLSALFWASQEVRHDDR